MEQVFVCRGGVVRDRWREAFPEARVVVSMGGDAALPGPQSCILWLDVSLLEESDWMASLRQAVARGYRVVVMTPSPAEANAFRALSLGATGYCHLEAAPQQLREIATVVEHGGIWMLPELVRRLMGLSLRVAPAPAPERPELDTLTARELMVARLVAQGESNREIAETLEITERTVKAHLTAIFEKLRVRDRVQLALAMNNIVTHPTIN